MPTNIPSDSEKAIVADIKEVKVINIEAPAPINFMDGLALLLIGLKLGTDRLEAWTWIEILAPLWGPIMIAWFFRLLNTTLDIGEDEESK